MKRCTSCTVWVENAALNCHSCGKDVFASPRGWGVGTVALLSVAGLAAFSIIYEAINPSKEQGRELTSVPQQSGSSDPAPYKVKILAERRLKASLRDPASAEVRNSRVPFGMGYMCGEVNARNGFGGMTGYRRFVAGASSQMPIVIEGEAIADSEFENLWRKACT